MSSKIIDFTPPRIQKPRLDIEAVRIQAEALTKPLAQSIVGNPKLNNPQKTLLLEILVTKLDLLQRFYLSYKLSPCDLDNLESCISSREWNDLMAPLLELIDYFSPNSGG